MLPTPKSVSDKHSPGPWIVDPDDPLSIVCPALSTPTLLEVVADCSDETGRERALAAGRGRCRRPLEVAVRGLWPTELAA